jgi:hypothetical protein
MATENFWESPDTDKQGEPDVSLIFGNVIFKFLQSFIERLKKISERVQAGRSKYL